MSTERHTPEYIKSIYKINTLCTEQRITITVVWNTHQMSRAEFISAMRVWREYWIAQNPRWKLGESSLSFNRMASYGKVSAVLIPVVR